MLLSADELKNVLGDLELNEGTISGLQTLVENALNEKINAAVQDAEAVLKETHAQEIAALNESILEQVNNAKKEISNKVEGYTAYAMKEYMRENEEKFKNLENLERIQESFKAIKSAFESNGFELKTDETSARLESELNEAKTTLDSVVVKLNEANLDLRNAKNALIFEHVTKNLADTQKEKVQELMESVTFDSTEDYQKAIEIIAEQVISVKAPQASTQTTLNEEVSPEMKAQKERMESYRAAARGEYIIPR